MVRANDKKGRLAILPFSDELFPVLLASVPEQKRYESMHVVLRDGTVKSAGDAVVEMMRIFPKSRWSAWLADVFPPFRRRIAAQYEKTAARRGELSAKVPDAELTIVRPATVNLPDA